MDLKELGLGPRIINALTGGGVLSMADLLESTPEDLLWLPYFGPASLGKVVEALSRHGLALAPSPPRLSVPFHKIDYREQRIKQEERAKARDYRDPLLWCGGTSGRLQLRRQIARYWQDRREKERLGRLSTALSIC